MTTPTAVCVLTAAGSGSRLGANQPKALVPLAGHTLLAWALRGLQRTGQVAAVVVTAPEAELDLFTAELPNVEVTFPVSVAAGGRSRQESVANGLDALKQLCSENSVKLTDETVTLIHDAARPLTPPALISDLVQAVRGGKSAVIPGLPVTDTIKVVDGGEPDGTALVVDTPPRAQLRSVQTPQAFNWKLIVDVHERARDLGADESSSMTDDAGLVELFGGPVWVIPGSADALKVTTIDDLGRAEALALTLSF